MQVGEEAKNKEDVVGEKKITDDIQEPERTGYVSEFDGAEVEFELQYRDHETDTKDVINRIVEDYSRRGSAAGEIKAVHVYLKPTDFTAYYVVNDSYEGKIALF